MSHLTPSERKFVILAVVTGITLIIITYLNLRFGLAQAQEINAAATQLHDATLAMKTVGETMQDSLKALPKEKPPEPAPTQQLSWVDAIPVIIYAIYYFFFK